MEPIDTSSGWQFPVARYIACAVQILFPQPSDLGERPFSLVDFLANVLRAWRKIICWIVVCLVAGLMYLVSATPKYSVTVSLIPIPDWLSIQPQKAATGLSSLLGGNQVNLFGLLGQSVQEKQVYLDLDRKFSVRERLFSQLWDPQTKAWNYKRDHSLLGFARRGVIALRSFAGYPAWKGPTIDSVRDYYSKMIILTNNTDGSVTIEMKSANPAYDTRALEFILARADGIIRAEMIGYIQKTIDGLETQLLTTSEANLRAALINSLGEQLAERASLQNNRILAMQTAPTAVSDTPRYPSWPGVIIVAFLMGIIIPVGALFARRIFRLQG